MAEQRAYFQSSPRRPSGPAGGSAFGALLDAARDADQAGHLAGLDSGAASVTAERLLGTDSRLDCHFSGRQKLEIRSPWSFVT